MENKRSKQYDSKLDVYSIEVDNFYEELIDFQEAVQISERRIGAEEPLVSRKELSAIYSRIDLNDKYIEAFEHIDPKNYDNLTLDYLYQQTEGTDKTAVDVAEQTNIKSMQRFFKNMLEERDVLWNLEHEYLGALKIFCMEDESLDKYMRLLITKFEANHAISQLQTIDVLLKTNTRTSDPYDDQANIHEVDEDVKYYDGVVTHIDGLLKKVDERIKAENPKLYETIKSEEKATNFPVMPYAEAIPYIDDVISELSKESDDLDYIVDNDMMLDREKNEEILSRLEREVGIDTNISEQQSTAKRISNYKFEK